MQSLSIKSTVLLSSGYTIPLLGLGVYRNTGSSVVPACIAAFETGYRHIDSAKLYANEREVGDAVANSGLKREEVFISKQWHSFDTIPHIDLLSATKIRSVDHARVRPQLTHSLKEFNASNNEKFQFEYIDLLLIHDPLCGPQNRLKMWKALLQARDEGLVKSVGVSNL
jgi:diketogulonate reductase-like aldo/keto reductase